MRRSTKFDVGYMGIEIILYIRNNYKLHIKNAEEGDSVSQYYIGYYYCYDIFSTKLDYSKAIELYSKSSEGGNIKFELGGYKLALNELGRCCYFGICTFKDEDKAFEFYLKTAEKCHSYSQYKVANYYNDRKHIPKNEEKGFY
ncbi:unnamed protein product [Rhizophagus irregularis]|nr:unnamed protein product [Rhizophagus irregularis]